MAGGLHRPRSRCSFEGTNRMLFNIFAHQFRSWRGVRVYAPVLLAGLLLPSILGQAQAQSTIVALGASNTYGKGVGTSLAWPARLQAMLKSKGINARVINAGVNGDTTGGMLARLGSAVPPGTRLVILAPGGNDMRRGLAHERAGNIARIEKRLAAQKTGVIVLEFSSLRPERGPDGIHFTAGGHARIAAAVLPRVVAALGR
jgi:acyl-CoA thioesterase I